MIKYPYFRTGLMALSLLLSSFLASAQNAATLVRRADRLLAEGRTAEAAGHYEKAWQLKRKDPAPMFLAAECYFRLRDYAKAADCYRQVATLDEGNETAGLYFGRALKQSGRPDSAALVFKDYIQRLKGRNRSWLTYITLLEIKGCELALETLPIADSAVTVQRLPSWINSTDNEFAPVPFSDRLLYYSLFRGGAAAFMRAQKKDNVWQIPEAAQGLPASLAGRFGNGTFSADGQRFYCTQCDDSGETGRRKDKDDRYAHCEIYLLRRDSAGWSEPIRLRDPINVPGSTAMHPYAVQANGKEYLYFASSRPGGFGGLDLYVCEREADSPALDFSPPQNLGNQINTAGDEVTPFFDAFGQTLWFSSNGLVSIGGLDVFKSTFSEGQWNKPDNAGRPINSPADDLFFVQRKSGYGGFFISNRRFGEEKTQTRDQDIFEFSGAVGEE